MHTFCDCADLDFPNNVLKCPECGEKTSKIDGYGLIMPGNYTWKIFENISRWHVTEKIGGLLSTLKAIFTEGLMQSVFDEGTTEVVLYGEGFGPGIQSWHYDLGKAEFILFDVLVGNVWLEQAAVTEIANSMGIERVPVLGENLSTVDAVMKCYGEPESVLTPGHPMEGVVARAEPVVLHRIKKTPIQWKLKVSDYVKLKQFRDTGSFEETKGGV
jgi:hypothetical protein